MALHLIILIICNNSDRRDTISFTWNWLEVTSTKKWKIARWKKRTSEKNMEKTGKKESGEEEREKMKGNSQDRETDLVFLDF